MPYITAYDGEDIPYQLALAPHAEATDGQRLSYVNAVPTDWMFGVLWHRHGLSRAGNPEWKLVNTSRQRRCMRRNLCQVCGQSAADEDGRVWWVMAEPPGRSALGEPFTNAPPTCRTCIPMAQRLCPRLREGCQVFTVRGVEPYGVVAEIFRPVGGKLLIRDTTTEMPLDAFRDLEYSLARQLIVKLEHLRPAILTATGETR
ncbi:hypothetical protein FXF51_06345 [Nonomuraea sp. PA05]|uniref:hypothetical protein n=1 Tax=Nonomuraea sp. PA05 TaxID=2604466 RepID=UPI0011DC2C6D|nr:hypothetical protein [Nonomuraea sp. PA05]TYB69781.1 hypothetical protein FXF51_06345 [Nonomuraea sp. PA05]